MELVLQRLFAPVHAGRSINATLSNGKKFAAHFDEEGFCELPDDEAQHMVECGSGLIHLVTPELLMEVKEQEEEEALTYMQKWKMKMGDEEEEVPVIKAKTGKKKSKADKESTVVKTGKKVKSKTKPKKAKTTL